MRVKMRKSPPPGLAALGHPPRKGAGWVLVDAIVSPSSAPWEKTAGQLAFCTAAPVEGAWFTFTPRRRSSA